MARVFAIGDMHGCVSSYAALLIGLGLTDSEGRWTGGDLVLVQTGDLIDRGPKSIACLKITKRLQEEARKSGGDVVMLLGGHEIFALAAAQGNDWAFLNWFSAQNGGSSVLVEWLEDNREHTPPESSSELRGLYGPLFQELSSGEIGQWLKTCPTCALYNDTLFCHAGISRDIPQAVDDLNTAAALSLMALKQYLTSQSHAVLGRRGPYWVRDLTLDEVTSALRANDARRMIVGHCPVPWVTSYYDGRLFVIDTGVVRGGPPLGVLVDDKVRVLDTNGRQHLPDEVRRDERHTKKAAAAPAKGRYSRGDKLEFYHSPISGGRAILSIHDVWSLGPNLMYSGQQMAYIPERKDGPIRFNQSEIWTYPGALIERVGVPLPTAAEEMPPDLKKSLALFA